MIKKGSKLKINHNIMIILLMFFTLFEGYYWAIIPKFFTSQSPRYLIWAFLIIVTMFSSKFLISRSIYLLPWSFYLLIIIVRNQEFAHGEYLNSERIILCILSIFVCSYSYKWILKVPKLIILTGILNVFATIAFFLNNSIYEKFISRTYQQYQNGTANGLYGYRAGMADHYSQNGTYISIVLISIISILINIDKKDKKRKWLILLCVLSIIALLLTGKRAHLLFILATSILAYYIENPTSRIYKTFKLMIFVVIIVFVGAIIIEYIPQLSYTFERLQNVGVDTASMNRIVMWEYCLKMIKRSPIIGVGWWGFRYETEIINILYDAVTGCHNVYLEILANCGIVGFIIFLFVILTSLISNVKNINYILAKNDLKTYKTVLILSLSIQIFCLMYGFTGNVMFDRTFHFYIVAVCVNYTFTINREKLSCKF